VGEKVQKGYQPMRVVSPPKPKPQGGFKPLTGEGAPTNPPNQGSGRKEVELAADTSAFGQRKRSRSVLHLNQ